MYNHKWWRIAEGGRAGNKNGSKWTGGTFNGDSANWTTWKKRLRHDLPRSLAHSPNVYVNERSTSLPFLLNKWERERVGNELIRADERRHEKVARTYQPNIVGLIWRCAGVGQHWPPHWSGDTLSDHPDQHRGYRGSRGPASFSRSRFRHLSRGLREGSSWHWKPTRPIGPRSGIYISSLALSFDSCNTVFSLHSELKGHRNQWVAAWKSRASAFFFSPSSKLCSNLSRSLPLSSSFSTFFTLFLSRFFAPVLKILLYFLPGFHNIILSLYKKKFLLSSCPCRILRYRHPTRGRG